MPLPPFSANMSPADASALAALCVSESRYRRIFETAQDGILLLNSETAQIEDVNPYLIQLLGYTHADFLGKKLWEVGAFAHTAQSKEMFVVLQDKGYVRYENMPLKTSDGTRIEVEFVSNTYDCDGVKVIQCNIRDIRERKKVERALFDSELRTRLLLQSSNVGLWDWNLLTGEVYFSPEWKHQLGYADHEIENHFDEWQKRLHPLDIDKALLAAKEFRDGLRASYCSEFRMKHKDDSWRWIAARAEIIRDAKGLPVRMMGSHIDVTEGHEARSTIREAMDRQAAIIGASMDAIIAIDKSERVLIFSHSAERMFQVPAAEVIGHTLDRFIPVRHRAGHHAHIAHFGIAGVLTREMGQFRRLTALRPDGTEFPIEASISHVPTSLGQLFTVTIRDISERESAEAARALLETQLRESQKMEAIGTLAGGIAHDFNNIIATIMGNAELAVEDTSAIPKAQESLHEILKAARRARDLVQQILAFGRRRPPERNLIELNAPVMEAVRLLRAVLPARVNLDYQADPANSQVSADFSQIQQVVINLGTNALHAMHHKPGTIRILLDTVLIDAAYADKNPALRSLYEHRPGMTARLSVSDDGIGMDAATLSRVFEPFFTTKPAGEGTGLGLSVVHGIVQGHHGVITVDSEPAMGTTFTLYLPLAIAQHNVSAKEATGALVKKSPVVTEGRHILYLDDEEALVYLVSRLLERNGYRVSGYTSQGEALAALRANPSTFDLVVTDYNMPGMSGMEVAREVRGIRADLPVAIASGYLDEELRAQFNDAGVKELIFKATELKDFCETIQRLACAK